MSLQSDIYTALAGLVDGRVYPQIARLEVALPYVVWRIRNEAPLQALAGYQGQTQYSVVFEAWADDYDGAVALAGDVQAAIEASAMTSYRESASGEDFDPALDAFIEPVFFGFWHT